MSISGQFNIFVDRDSFLQKAERWAVELVLVIAVVVFVILMNKVALAMPICEECLIRRKQHAPRHHNAEIQCERHQYKKARN